MAELYAVLREQMERHHGPLGERLRLAIGDAIERGIVPPGESLPAEREMAEQLNLSRSTLRQALKDLAGMGMVESRHGAGTVVLGRVSKSLSRLSGFTEDMHLRGMLPSSRVIECRVGPVDPETAFRTGLTLGTPMLTLVRLRLAGNEPMSYEKALVPVTAVGEDYDGSGSLYERMDARGGRPRRMMQSLRAIEADTSLASHLAIKKGAPVLEITQLGYDGDGHVIEDAVSWYRGDRYRYVGEIRG